MTLQNRKPLNRMSEKKRASLGGRAFSTIAPGAPTKKKARSTKETRRIYGGAERIAWMQRQPCVIEGKGSGPARHRCFGAIENAHTATGGMGRKADADTIVPLCSSAHALLHAVGVKSFQVCYGVDLSAERTRIAALWEARCG